MKYLAVAITLNEDQIVTWSIGTNSYDPQTVANELANRWYGKPEQILLIRNSEDGPVVAEHYNLFKGES